jgi:nitroimidazol reductase NimA-like FMN-containing flavoprotein (pyridoxamine 5'-phosphate oxidase superfamily)
MADNVAPMTVLSPTRCWDLLAGQQLGRLVLVTDGKPEIFPVNYAVDGESLVFRTAQGTKLDGITQANQVAFEVDTWDIDHGYSVVVRGTAAAVSDPVEVARVEALRLKPWIPTIKTVFVRITAVEITGRKFVFGLDPIEKYR